MPGLLRGMARTAVVAGTATAVSNRVSRRQAERWSQEDMASAAPQQPAAQDDEYAEIERLSQLKQSGMITEEEFNAKKRQILGI